MSKNRRIKRMIWGKMKSVSVRYSLGWGWRGLGTLKPCLGHTMCVLTWSCQFFF